MKRFLNTILNGDSLTILKTMPDACVDMTMTSPPYWALRDYGVNGQIGLEHTFDKYIHRLCDIFDEIWRVTKPSGTCWVNLGDTYSGNKKGNKDEKISDYVKDAQRNLQKNVRGLSEKSLTLIPFRFSIEMINRGWILRNVIIWHKPNSMPASAKDRFTVDFEYLFFFSKSKKYFFDQDLVRIPHNKDQRLDGIKRAREFGYDGNCSYQDWYFNKRQGKDWVNKKETKDVLTFGQAKRNSKTKPPTLIHPLGRNRRCIWTIPTRPYKGAHFAVYPETLCTVPIQAGCPKEGVVLDPFAGSGTTLKVAKELGRNYIGIELNPEYIKLAEKRLAENGKTISSKQTPHQATESGRHAPKHRFPGSRNQKTQRNLERSVSTSLRRRKMHSPHIKSSGGTNVSTP